MTAAQHHNSGNTADSHTRSAIVGFACVNLLAAYVPALMWVWFVPVSPEFRAWIALFSPVALAVFFVPENVAVYCCVLIAFLVFLVLGSALLHRWSMAREAMPFLVSLYSLTQGIPVLLLIVGMNGI